MRILLLPNTFPFLKTIRLKKIGLTFLCLISKVLLVIGKALEGNNLQYESINKGLQSFDRYHVDKKIIRASRKVYTQRRP